MGKVLADFDQKLKCSKTLTEAVTSFQMGAFDINRSLELLNTEQKLLTAASKSGIMFEPKKVVLQQKTVQRLGEFEEENYLGVIMPMKEQIKKFLELPNVYSKIMENQIDSLMGTKYTNLVNGSVWTDIMKLYEGKDVVPIALYCDEFNPDKDTSSHAKDTKLNAYYYSFLTLPDYVATNIKNIFIALLYKVNDVDKKSVASHGIDPALHALLDVLIPLSREPIQINVDGVTQEIYIVAPQFFGDNEALNTVLGFSRSFSGAYFCRICMIHRTQMEFSVEINEELIRNENNYNECLAGHTTETKKGVKYNCPLNILTYFWVYRNISVDIMHDAFLGVLKYDLISILIYYIHFKRIFTLDQFNEAKDRFDYGKKSAGDRTATILDSHLTGEKPSIHMAAKEMWTLMENLPLILMSLVPLYETCEIFKFVVIITKLIHVITKKAYTEDDISEMDSIIKEHHLLYLTIFNRAGYENHLTFKFHVMLHYALYIRTFGPLRNSMTFKFESKHQQLKRYARQCFSRVNLPFSLCKKFCLEFSYFVSTNPNIFVELENPSIIKTSDYTSAIDNVQYCSKIEYKGYAFEWGDIIRKQENIYVIRGIAVNFDYTKAYLYCQEVEEVFHPAINFFEIRNILNVFSELEISTITSRPVNIHNVNNRKMFFFRN